MNKDTLKKGENTTAECHCSQTSRYHTIDSYYQHHTAQKCWREKDTLKERVEDLRELYIEEQCEEKEDDHTRFAVYENDAEFIADWWIDKIHALIEQTRKEERDRIVEMIEETQKTIRLEQFTVDTIINNIKE